MECNDCAEFGCNPSDREISVSRASFCISQGAPLSSAQVDNGEGRSKRHNVTGLNYYHNDDSEVRHEAAEEPERCTVVQAV